MLKAFVTQAWNQESADSKLILQFKNPILLKGYFSSYFFCKRRYLELFSNILGKHLWNSSFFCEVCLIKVMLSYCLKWIRVFRCFCCPYMVIIALILIILICTTKTSSMAFRLVTIKLKVLSLLLSKCGDHNPCWHGIVVLYFYDRGVISVLQIILNWISAH